MPELACCPEVEVLHQFTVGQVAPEDVEELAGHILHCERCVAALQGLKPDDTLTSAIFSQATSGEKPLPPAVDRLMRQLQSVPMVRDAAPLDATGPPVETKEEELTSFLAPALQPDELGRLGGYRVLKLLGAGGMGIVFQAEDPQLKRLVALKVMKPAMAANKSSRQRFLREAQATAAIHNDHIVTIHQVGEDGGVPFLAMEFLEGEPLDHWLQRGRKPTLAQTLRMGREMAKGLAAAHERGLIHRDIKPGNIWLEAPTGRVKILDFGLALAPADQSHLTQSGMIVGTPSFMAPEQARGDSVDHRCDLFSLGCVLYRLCAGQLPFSGPNTMAVLTALALNEPTALTRLNAQLPPALARLIEQMLAKDPAGRPKSARAVEQALKGLERELNATAQIPVAAPVTPVPAPVRRRPRRQLAVAAACALLFAAVVPGVIILLKGPDGKVTEIKVPDGIEVKVIPDGTGKKPPDSAPAPVAERPRDKDKPFVLVRGDKERWEFRDPAEIFPVLQPGDAIEIHGNGPFALGTVQLAAGQGLTLRAAPGYRPRLVADLPPGTGRWLEVVNGPVVLEGCDFENANLCGFLYGSGDSWELRNCRFFMVGSTLTYFSGGRLRIQDSLVSVGPGTNSALCMLGPKTEVEFSNSLVRYPLGRPLFYLMSPGGQTIRLRRNTVIAGSALLQPDLSAAKELSQPATVEAEGNLFYLQGPWRDSKTQTLKDLCRWQGRQNLYVGPDALVRMDPALKVLGNGLEAWKAYWGQEEEGSRVVEAVAFQWDEVPLGQLDVQAARLQRAVADLRQQTGKKDADWGPRWDLVGPGEAYVRALAEEGKAPVKDQLRPPGRPDGPILLVRAGKVVRGFLKLQDAVDVAGSGDTIEIRSDGPLAGATLRKKIEALTLAAAPGYRPILTGKLETYAGTQLDVEGIHFSAEGPFGTGFRRLVNCSWVGTAGGNYINANEFLRCQLPRNLNVHTQPDLPVSFRHCLLQGIVWNGQAEGPNQLLVDHCAVWVPGTEAGFNLNRGAGTIAVTAQATLFDLSGQAKFTGAFFTGVYGPRLTGWSGTANVYCIGRRQWLYQEDNRVNNLAGWRQKWKSDNDSIEADPLDYDPLQWRLLPQSPGHQQGPDGKDYGADVDRVARTIP